MKTSFMEMFGMSCPIAQAPMGRCAPPEMAAAVANAGGLGMMGVSWDSLETIEDHFRVLSTLTNKDIVFNFCLEMDQDARIQLALDHGVKTISLFWGDATPHVNRIKSAGAKVISSVGSVEDAKRDLDAGVDALCVQGFEAGGHVYSTTGALSLIPAVADLAGDVPLIAAGGFVNGRGLAAALTLGAGAVWMGTRFLASKESFAHPDYVKAILEAGHDCTVSTELFDLTWPDAPHRVIRNSTFDAWEAQGGQTKGADRPGHGEVVAYRGDEPMYRYDESGPNASMTGNVEALALYAGQSVGMIHDVKGCAEIVDDVVSEAEALLGRSLRS